MKGALSSVALITILLSSACATRFNKTIIHVECAEDVAADPTRPRGGSTPQDDLPEQPSVKEGIPKKKEYKEPTSQDDLPQKNPIKQESIKLRLRNGLIRLIDHSMDNSCPTNGKEAAAIAQETDTWCWSASAHAVMKFHGANAGTNISQCNIVNTVYNFGQPTDGDATAFCCDQIGRYDSTCQKNGLPDQAFDAFGFTWKWVVGPLQPKKVAGQICHIGPFIFVLLFQNGGGHSLVVKDYVDIGGTLYLLVHDHSWELDGYIERTPLPFELWPYDAFANGEYLGMTHEHAFDYVQILPQ